MRILILTSVYPPLGYSGHDVRCCQTVQGLVRRGHQLQVLTSNYRLPPMGVAGEKGVFREFHLHPKTEGGLLGASYQATYAHERYNAESLEYRIGRFKPDVVYIWNMQGLSKSLLFRLQDRGIRLVYDIHSDCLSPECFNLDPWYRWWRNNPSKRSKIYRAASRLIGRARRALGLLPIDQCTELDLSHSYVCSEWLKKDLFGKGLEAVADLPVVYPSIETRELTVKTEFSGQKRFIWAGRLDVEKAPLLAVDAVRVLLDRGVDVSLDIFGIGEPSERKTMRETIEAAGLIDRISMRGIRPGELSEQYQNYDALLYTSRVDEPFSMTVLGALLSKLPCILSEVSGHREIVGDDEAFFFQAGDAESLADTMERFMDQGDHGQGLANGVIERLQEDHSVDSFCAKVEPLLMGQ